MLSGMYEGRRIVSLDLTDEEWAELCSAARHKEDGKLTSPITGDPMMCVHMQATGLRFFRMHPGGHDGLTERETEHHIRLKKQVYETAKRLGYKVDVEHPADDRSWIADVYIQRRHHRPLAVEVQWSNQNDEKFKMRTDRYAGDGVDCLWLDAGLDWPTVERDCWGGDPDTETTYPEAWSGITPVDGVNRLPVNRHTELVRYDGAWHTAGETIADLLEGRLNMYHERPARKLEYRVNRCYNCGQANYVWTFPDSERYPDPDRPRAEERFASIVSEWSARKHPGLPGCYIAPRLIRSTGLAYRAFCCPRCHRTQGERFLRRGQPYDVLTVPDSGEVDVLRTPRPASADVAYPNMVGPTTYDAIQKAKGCNAGTRADDADYRMRLLGWEDVRHPPKPRAVRRVKEAARAMVDAMPQLRESSDWRAGNGFVSCDGAKFDLSVWDFVLC